MVSAFLTVLIFCRALTANDIRAFTPLIGGQQNPPTRILRRLRNVTENFDCVTVSSYRWQVENNEIVIDVDAEGITRNAKHERRAIPQRWFIRAGSFDDETSRLESLLIDASSDTQRDALLAQSSDEVIAATARLMSEDVPLSDAAAMRAAAEFLINWSRDSENHEVESYALCALGNIDSTLKPRLFDAARDTARRSQSCDAIAYADYQASTIAPKPVRIAMLNTIADSLESLDNPRPGIIALRDLSGMYSLDYALSDAYAAIDRLNSVSLRYGNAEGVARALFFRGRAAGTMFDDETAVPLLLKARAMAEDAQLSRTSAVASFSLYYAYIRKVQYEKARESLRAALHVLQREDGDLIALAHAYLASLLVEHFHEVREAERHYEIAISMPEIGASRQSVLGTGAYLRYETGRYEEALKIGREAIALDPDALDWVWSIKGLIGRILVECGHLDEGIDALREAIDFVEARRALSTTSAIVRAGYTHQRGAPYVDLIGALISGKRFAEALAIAEHLKARSLSEDLPHDAGKLPLTEAERQQEREINQRIVDLNRTIRQSSGDREAEARLQLRNARAELEQFTVETFMRHSTNAWVVKDDVSDFANRRHGATVIEYALIRGVIAAFVVREGKISARLLTVTEALEARAKRFVERIVSRDIDYGEDGRALYDALIAPLADLLPQEGILAIVPEAFLWTLPFDALVTPSHHFLAERYAIAYAPSLLMLSRAAERPHSRHQSHELLAVGDPFITSATVGKASEYRGLSLGAIPDALHEARALASLYGAQHSTVLTGAAARESVLKKVIGDYRIVHLATHGVVDDASPLYSAIVLASAKGDPDDGLLEMREMSELNLHADLVVLSGCDTARGDVLSGEGVIDMSWALFSAGCPTTVVSQWKAMSHSTAQFMIAFHKHLHDGEPKAAALRHARLDLLKIPAYHHPFYWAPFVMVGEGEERVQ